MKKYLIVIDMQKDFIDGSLGTKEAQAIVPNVIERIIKAREEGTEIFLTQDTHYKNYLSTQEGKNLPVPHCVYGTEGHVICPGILAKLEEYPTTTINKPTFGSVWLADDLVREISNDPLKQSECEIEILGLCTDICVISNALLIKAFLPEVKISVNASCCAGVTPELHEAALKVMKSCQIEII